MPRFASRLSKRKLILFTVVWLACSVVAVIAVTRNSLKRPPPTAASVANNSTSTSANSSSQHGSVEAEIVTLHAWGFEPKEITRPPGPFFLAVDNESGASELNVSLEVESGPRQRALALSRNKARWREKLVLPPGVYVLRESNNPEWTCRITVQP